MGTLDYAGKYSAPGIRAWLVLATFMAWNALFHMRGAVHTRRYSPGMVTGLLLFVPLSICSYVHFLSSGAVDALSVVPCVVVALLIQPVMDFIKSGPKLGPGARA